MNIKRFCVICWIGFTLFAGACSGPKKVVETPLPPQPPVAAPAPESKANEYMVNLFKTQPALFNSILSNRKDRNVQVIYTQIDRGANGNPHFTHHQFNVDESKYFYPASTVKFPVAVLALQKLREMNIAGLDKNSTMITESATPLQTAVFNDPNTPDGKPTIAQYIKKIFLVSDNDAFNRLYEFLGQEYINTQLHKKGYTHTQLLHRLDIFLPEAENRMTNPIRFFDGNKNLLYSQPMLQNKQQYTKRNDTLGTGHYSGGQLIQKPMDFSKKNKLPLQDLHNMMTSIIFPQSVKASHRFNISEEDRLFVLKYMSAYPRESVYPYYDPNEFRDSYAKMILLGNEDGRAPASVRIFSKSGWAYGQLTETAYVVDFDKNIEFLVTATINCNTDGIYNDDQYDFEGIGYPFMRNLGMLLYQHESNRKKQHLPDLSEFKLSYDK